MKYTHLTEIERFHKTIKNEFYDIAFRKKIYTSLEELQTDVNHWLKEYNEFRPHSGPRCYGKTPMKTFLDSKKLARQSQLENLFQKDDNDGEFIQQNSMQNEVEKNLHLSDK